MKFKRLLNVLAAAVIALGCTFSVCADEANLTPDGKEPTLSFDSSEWNKYLAGTRDSKIANLSMDTVKNNAYQAMSLCIKGTATKPVAAKNCTYAPYLKDKDGKKLYPFAGLEGIKASTVGVEIAASNFGLKNFDGCVVEFTYRFGEDVKGKLLQDSSFVFPTNDNYKVLTENPVQLVYDKSEKDNVTQYAKGVLNVKSKIDATKIVFELPVTKSIKDTVLLYLDNIKIKTPQKKDGKLLYVGNVDSYNSSAEPAAINEKAEAHNEDKAEAAYGDTSTESDKKNPLFIAGGIIVGIIIVAGVVIFIIKRQQQFY